jgi:hypothetical protein
MEAACQAVDLRVRVDLLRNDAEAAIAALTKGSTGSAPMQRQAVRLNRVAYTNDLDLILTHVPGLALVEEGIDGASRAGSHFGPDANLANVLGPRVSDGLWASITSLPEPLRWRVTVDLFATEANARAERFFSRFGEPGAEAIDAFAVLDCQAGQPRSAHTARSSTAKWVTRSRRSRSFETSSRRPSRTQCCAWS